MMRKIEWKDRVDWSKRKSRLAKKICDFFETKRKEKLSFGEILDKYCEKGMSIDKVSILLEKLTDRIIPIKRSALHEAWRASAARGNCNFIFHSKWPGNPHHGNRGIVRAVKKIDKVPHENHPVIFECTSCKKAFKGKANITKEPNFFVGLKTSQCPKCKTFGLLNVTFKMKEKTYHKTMVDGHETFQKPKKGKTKCQKEPVGSLSENN